MPEADLAAMMDANHTPRLRRLLRRQVRGDVTELPSSPAPASSEGSLRTSPASSMRWPPWWWPRSAHRSRSECGELRAIPAGSTTTYGDVARALGQPTASRAVGLANGSNPVALVIPCHRVIGASGSLTG